MFDLLHDARPPGTIGDQGAPFKHDDTPAYPAYIRAVYAAGIALTSGLGGCLSVDTRAVGLATHT